MSVAVVAFGAVSALGEGEAAVAPSLVGEAAPVGVRRDPELAAAGLLRPFCARVDVEGEDRATMVLLRALDACARDLDDVLPGWRTRRVGLAIGTSSGAMRSFERAWPEDPAVNGATYLAPVLAAEVATRLGLAEIAPFTLVLGACASSSLALGVARSWLASDACDVALAGGFDAVSVFVASGFEALRATAGERGPLPFRRERQGLALGEGAAVAALVREELVRGRVHGWIAGFGASCDAAHLTAPDRRGAGLARAARAALDEAGLARVDLVSAHGTATEANDAAEALAIGALPEARDATVHAFKGSVGHTLGAAGALETLSALVAIERGVLPASVGSGPVVEGVRVLDRTESGTPESVLKLSAAFGGSNAALVVGRSRPRATACVRPVYVSRAVAVTGEDVATSTTPSALAVATGQPEDRVARGDLLVRLALAATGRLAGELGPLHGAGIVVGEGLCTLETNVVYLERSRSAGAARVEPRRFPFTTPNAAAGECAVAFGLEGPAFAVGGGAHGGIEALAVAADLVRAGHAERIVVVAADEGGPASRRAFAGSTPGAVACLVGAAPLSGTPSARLEEARIVLGKSGSSPVADALPGDAHRGLLPLATGRPASLEVGTHVGIVAKARFLWL